MPVRIALAVLITRGASACRGADETPPPTPTTEAASTVGVVDVGGYELDWMCRGTGSPTIIAEAGYDSAGTSTWFDLLGPLSEISRACTYDRAGTSTSDHGPDGLHVTGMLEAEELRRLWRAPASSRRTRSSATRTAGS